MTDLRGVVSGALAPRLRSYSPRGARSEVIASCERTSQGCSVSAHEEFLARRDAAGECFMGYAGTGVRTIERISASNDVPLPRKAWHLGSWATLARPAARPLRSLYAPEVHDLVELGDPSGCGTSGARRCDRRPPAA
jgi:hypothetical protein